MRASKSSASSTNAAPGSSAASYCAHSPPLRPPAQPVIGLPRGSRGSVWAKSFRRLVSCLTVAGSAPFCGPKTSAARSNGVRTSHTQTILAPPRPPASSIASMAPAAPSVVALPPQATSTTCAPSATAAAMSSPVPRVDAATASRSSGATSARPLARAISMTAVPPSSSSA